jgi:hypothetical protein
MKRLLSFFILLVSTTSFGQGFQAVLTKSGPCVNDTIMVTANDTLLEVEWRRINDFSYYPIYGVGDFDYNEITWSMVERVAGGLSSGSGASQLSSPEKIFVDTAGALYIADKGNHRIQKWLPGDTSGVTVAGGNGAGSASDQLNAPTSVLLDDAGNIYVLDAGNCRIQKYAPGSVTGVTVAGGNGCGTSNNQLVPDARDFYLDQYNHLLVCNGQTLIEWPLGAPTSTSLGTITTGAFTSTFRANDGVIYNATSEFPSSILQDFAYDKDSNFIFGIRTAYGVITGLRLAAGLPSPNYSTNVSAMIPTQLFRNQSSVNSSNPSYLSTAKGIAYHKGYFYVSDASNHRISKWPAKRVKAKIKAPDPGYYYAVVTNTAGQKDTTNIVRIGAKFSGTLFSSGPNPTCASLIYTTLLRYAGYNPTWSNQWNFNGTPIAGATDSFYVPQGLVQETGQYTLTVSDSGCVGTSLPKTFTVNPRPEASFAITDVLCYGDSTGSIEATITVGTPPVTFAWYNYNLGFPYGTQPQATGLPAGAYSVVLNDANCPNVLVNDVGQPAQTIVELCAVTVDSTTGENLAIWNKQNVERAIGYKVYRETGISGQYALIDSVASTSFSTVLDTGSNPLQQSDKYVITAIDSCGRETAYSTPHKTIHLSANIGINGEVNLLWNQYGGMPYSSHYIMRSDNGSPYNMIGQVSSSNLSFSDQFPPAGNLRYRIDIDLATSCNPTAKTTSYDFVSSNKIEIAPIPTTVSTAHNVPQVSIYPNPAKGHFEIMGTHAGEVIHLHDMQGKLLASWTASGETTKANVTGLAAGVYTVSIAQKSNNHKRIYRLVIQ